MPCGDNGYMPDGFLLFECCRSSERDFLETYLGDAYRRIDKILAEVEKLHRHKRGAGYAAY